ncbi:Type I restriction enzyme specificity protein MPN_089 [Escherichia coli]|uniref:restriction endonuclease subunit S n=1 Tax=Escherichia coli TaxID=562 RepID=UPI0007A638E2|nr:restriction endonuclease subunit S [Escherichia coli]ELS5806778.1 restriction endonuclease subunit S [Escherichia coli]EMD3353971.1 restriction endonuclease subunit S [Escherichia coli]MBY8633546.1 restriction endonuclease subunit S [Escherichia coli]MBZ2349495.1 restriction endonuclease subunit S [Escherichia coli]MBZ2363483.1 restriction endonuclease subunit S [Escherichia coli]
MSELSYLEKLLDGVEVEWLPLGEITKYEQPTKYLVKAKDYHDTYTIPVLTAGKTFILGYTNETHGIYQASKAPVIIFDDFTTANKWVDFDFKAKSSAMKMVTSCDDNKTLLKYVYYWLNTLPSEFAEGDHKRQWISNYSQKKIPIPCPDNPEKSLAIQSEIVRILDKFTALTAELTAELNMRKKQYNYYRDQLLSFKEGEVEWKALEEVSDIYDSLHQTPQYSKNGLSMIRVTDIKNGYIDLKNTLKVNDGIFSIFTKKYLPQKNDLVMSRVGSYGNVGIIPTDNSACMGQNTVVIHPHINNRYLFYILTSSIGQDFIEKNVGGGSQKTLSLKSIKSIPIPLTGESEQSKIVSILDKFDTLTNSITEGLPREIELRQKQYEYYRDLLFSFPKPETVSN